MVVNLEPVGLGAYVEIIGCGSEILFAGQVVDSSITFTDTVPGCGAFLVNWTPLFTISPDDVVPQEN